MSRLLQFVLLAACSTFSASAFHLQPFRSGTSSLVSTGHQQNPNIVTGHDVFDYSTVKSRRSPHLFAARVDRNLEDKNGRMRRRFERISLLLLRLSSRISFRFRTLVTTFALFCMINLSVMPAWAGSLGRSGGSFGRSDRFRRPAITRTIRPSNSLGTTRVRAPTYRTIRAPIRNYNRDRSYRNYHSASGEQVEGEGVAIMSNTDGSTTVVRKVNTHPYATSRFSASDVVLVSGVTAVVANGIVKGRANRDKFDNDASTYPLGPGISVWRLTACLDVPNTNDPSSIVRRIQKIAERTSTVTRKGLQTLLAETSLELLRQLEKGSVASVESQYDHYRSSDQAEVRAQRQYSRISTKERSKFAKESWSNYNGNVVLDDSEEEGRVEGSSSLALLQIHVVIEGNMMKPFGVRQIETKKSLQEALVQLSGDLNAVEDCVLAGEVLWSPQQLDQNEVLTEEDIYVSHPMLWPVDYSVV